MEHSNAAPLPTALAAAIRSGDLETLRRLLAENPEIATARIVDEKGHARTPLHIATDWPGHFPNCRQTIAALIAAGADPNAAATGNPVCAETPLHWAASSDDVEAIDALLDGGADIEHPGAVFTNGAPMSDAVIFAQWNAARRLLARGAATTLTESAALGLLDRVKTHFAGPDPPASDRVTAALWHACRGGQLPCAEYLAERGANLNWIGWDRRTPLDCAIESGNAELAQWLRAHGAERAR